MQNLSLDSISFIKNKLTLFAIFTLFILFVIKFISSYYGFPISLGDKEGFYPVTFNYAFNKELIHPFLCFTCENILGNPHEKPFTNHGFLYPILLSKLMFLKNYEQIEISNIILFLLNGIIFLGIIKVNSFKLFFIFIISLSVFLYQIGRAELLVSTILLIDLYITKNKYFNYPIIFISLILAILFCISPLCSVIYFYYAYIKNDFYKIKIKYYKNIFIYINVPIITFIIFNLFVNDFTFIDWVSGLWGKKGHHTNIYSENYMNVDFVEYWIYFIRGPSSLPVVCIAYFVIFLGLLRTCQKAKIDYIFFVVVFLFLILYFGLRRPVFIYNAMPWIPFILLLLNFNIGLTAKFNFFLISIFAGFCSISIFYIALYKNIHTILNGNSALSLKVSLSKIDEKYTVKIPKQFYMFSKKGKNISLLHPVSPKEHFSEDIIYFHQFDLYLIGESVPIIKGYCIDEKYLNNSSSLLKDYSYIKYIKCN